jgi:hypothetical protein
MNMYLVFSALFLDQLPYEHLNELPFFYAIYVYTP